jgi:hypothetical protein
MIEEKKMRYKVMKYFERGMQNHVLLVKFTFECNNGCEICIENSTPDQKEILPIEKLQKVFDQVKDLELNCSMQGGEVMLYPEYCAEVTNRWRKTNKFGHTLCVTNGFWGDNPDTIKYMKEVIKPDVLFISVSKWHQKNVPISRINNIIRELDNSSIMVVILPLYSDKYPSLTQREYGLDSDKELLLLPQPLTTMGRAGNLSTGDQSPRMRTYDNEEIKCDNFGLSIHPDGTIGANCPAERNGCIFGHIDDTNVAELYDRLRRPKIQYTGTTYNFSAICRGLGINPLDPKWSK